MHFIRVIAGIYPKKDRYGNWNGPFRNMKNFYINDIFNVANDGTGADKNGEFNEVKLEWMDYSKNERSVIEHLKGIFKAYNIPDIETALKKVKIKKVDSGKPYYDVKLYFIPNKDLTFNVKTDYTLEDGTTVNYSDSIIEQHKIMELQHYKRYLTEKDFMDFIEKNNLVDFYNKHKEEIDTEGVLKLKRED